MVGFSISRESRSSPEATGTSALSLRQDRLGGFLQPIPHSVIAELLGDAVDVGLELVQALNPMRDSDGHLAPPHGRFALGHLFSLALLRLFDLEPSLPFLQFIGRMAVKNLLGSLVEHLGKA